MADETNPPDDRRAACSSLSPRPRINNRGNHETPQSGIPKRKKAGVRPRLSCKLEYLLRSNHPDLSTPSEFFTGDFLAPRYFQHGFASRETTPPVHKAASVGIPKVTFAFLGPTHFRATH